MGKESKIRELRRAKLIPQVKETKIYKPMSKGWRVTIWTIIFVIIALLGFGIWAYSGRKIEARIGSASITTDELEQKAYQLIQQQVSQDQMPQFGTEEFQKMLASAKEQVIQQLISEKLFLQLGERENIKIEDKVYQDEAQKLIDQQKPKEGNAAEWIKQQGFENEVKMREFIVANNKSQLTVQVYMNKLFEKYVKEPEVTDQEALDFYNSNAELKLSHILLKYDSTKDAADVGTKKKTQIDEIRAQIMKDPKKFPEIAKQKSEDDATKPNGGDLGWYKIQNGQLVTDQGNSLVPEFNDAAIKMKVGEVSEPVRTTYGWHLIYITDAKKNSEKYNPTEAARIATIRWVGTNKSDPNTALTADELKKKETQANQVLKDLLSGKITFAKAAEQYSEDDLSKFNAGELPSMLSTDSSGFFWAELQKAKEAQAGSYPYEKEIVEAAWGLKPNQVYSKVVKAGKDIVIVKLITKRNYEKLPFESVKQEVIKQLKAQKKSEQQSKWLEEERNKLGVSIGNPWKSFTVWWQSNIVAPFEDFGLWVGKLMGKGVGDGTTTTTTNQTQNLPSEEEMKKLIESQGIQNPGSQIPAQQTPATNQP